MLREPLHVLELVERLHPTPAVGGVPTADALRFIAEREPGERGWYAGPIGWCDARGEGEFAVALRSGLLEGSSANLYAGAGIVRASNAHSEWLETRLKLMALTSALGLDPEELAPRTVVKPPNLLTEWSRLLIGSLARAGVEHVVVSPGSRSTPFVWAAMNEPSLELDVIVDERSAGFFAVAHAKVSGAPSLLLCTSGSAGANYFPAIVEAAMTGTPLIVLTADGPSSSRAARPHRRSIRFVCSATTCAATSSSGFRMPTPARSAACSRAAAQAVHASCHPEPGPVHLNARAKKPLEPPARERRREPGARRTGQRLAWQA